ncbi:MAG: 4Fe-4S binding protein [Bacteroidetes bacterium]|nr:4Fe-4S binding protein [Bacteroidota bacterium]
MNIKNSKFDKVIIHYFSGTGNAKSVAHWIGDIANDMDINIQIVNIGRHEKANEKEITENTLLGFCYPTHGFNAPPIVIKYLWKLSALKSKNKFFVVNTRAGLKMSKVFIPGLSGLALLLPSIILILKGFRLIGYRSIDLPSNWISLHPGLKEKVIRSIFVRCKRITEGFSLKILSGNNVFTGFWWLPIDLALIPISLGYYFYGRFALSKTFIATSNCNGCNLCVENCPVNAIYMKDGKPYWSYKCESCMHCMNYCPTRAIETPHTFTAIIWWFSFAMLPLIIIDLLTHLTDFTGLEFKLIYDILLLILSISIIFSSYWLIHKLMNIKVFSKIMKYTSLTSYKFWRRYKAPKKFD